MGGLSLWVFTRRRGTPSDLFGRYQQNFEKTGSPAWLVDVETQAIVDANPAAVAFYGWPPAELIGREVSDINALPPEAVSSEIAAAGQEALQLFRAQEHEIDLIVTDVIMPRLSGLALCRQLRMEGKMVRFLFTTGYAAHEISRNDLPEGDLVLLQKPWSLAELSSKVREVLDADG